MASAIVNIVRLGRAGLVLALHGVRFVPKGVALPLPVRLAILATAPLRLIMLPFQLGRSRETRTATALTRLGPSYIKLGQFLATRADLIGAELASDLAHLQDKLPPFPDKEARRAVSSRGMKVSACW